MVDTNELNLSKARDLGLEAISANIYADDLTDNIELSDVGYLLAMTANDEINNQAISRFGKQFGETGTFRLISSEELKNDQAVSTNGLFSRTHDYLKFTEVIENFPHIQEISVDSHEEFIRLLNIIEQDDNLIALFLKKPDGSLDIISNPSEMEVLEDSNLVYIGKPIDFEELTKGPKLVESKK